VAQWAWHRCQRNCVSFKVRSMILERTVSLLSSRGVTKRGSASPKLGSILCRGQNDRIDGHRCQCHQMDNVRHHRGGRPLVHTFTYLVHSRHESGFDAGTEGPQGLTDVRLLAHRHSLPWSISTAGFCRQSFETRRQWLHTSLGGSTQTKTLKQWFDRKKQ
jgi:hypothetical protein